MEHTLHCSLRQPDMPPKQRIHGGIVEVERPDSVASSGSHRLECFTTNFSINGNSFHVGFTRGSVRDD